MISTKAAATAGIAAAAAAGLCATAAPAAAVYDVREFPTVYTLGQDGLCFGRIQSAIGPEGQGLASFQVDAQLYGVGSCSVPLTLDWRNLDTGETGTRTVTVPGPGSWNIGRSAMFRPGGVGQFVATLRVGPAHLPEPGTITFRVD
ncbi:hypothetical protein [Nocardia sp. NPDC048505]|uniref:hypothetical protein n=1 Tax=unclassified Nocardia TaxID=2637762 RepID=UPI0033FCBF90